MISLMKYNLRSYLCIVIPGWRDLATSHIVFVNLFVSVFLFLLMHRIQRTVFVVFCFFMLILFFQTFS